jgi:hypothetical protein
MRTDALYVSPRFKEMLGYTEHELELTFATFAACCIRRSGVRARTDSRAWRTPSPLCGRVPAVHQGWRVPLVPTPVVTRPGTSAASLYAWRARSVR